HRCYALCSMQPLPSSGGSPRRRTALGNVHQDGGGSPRRRTALGNVHQDGGGSPRRCTALGNVHQDNPLMHQRIAI
ncbi:MAG: hypothetical protein AAFS04_16760, partial [Cyanobacteria bacterium J06631_9]